MLEMIQNFALPLHVVTNNFPCLLMDKNNEVLVSAYRSRISLYVRMYAIITWPWRCVFSASHLAFNRTGNNTNRTTGVFDRTTVGFDRTSAKFPIDRTD